MWKKEEIIARDTEKKKSKEGRVVLLDIKTHYKAVIIMN